MMYLRGEVQLLTGGKAREPSKIGGLGETPGPTVRVWMGEDAITLDLCGPRRLIFGVF